MASKTTQLEPTAPRNVRKTRTITTPSSTTKPQQILTLDQLKFAVATRKAISTRNHFSHLGGHRGYLPAAWVWNLSAHMVHSWINSGMYIHQKKPK